MYYPYSENKHADHREADLHLCRLLVFPWGGSYMYVKISMSFKPSNCCKIVFGYLKISFDVVYMSDMYV